MGRPGARIVMRGRGGGAAPGSQDLLAGYYLATPLFAALDAVAGWPVRVAGFPDQGWRWGWYLILFLLGVLCRARPRLAPLVGMGESSVNLTFLFLSVLLPLWDGAAYLAGDGEAQSGIAGIVNLLLSGGVLVYSFHRSQWEWRQGLESRVRDTGPS